MLPLNKAIGAHAHEIGFVELSFAHAFPVNNFCSLSINTLFTHIIRAEGTSVAAWHFTGMTNAIFVYKLIVGTDAVSVGQSGSRI